MKIKNHPIYRYPFDWKKHYYIAVAFQSVSITYGFLLVSCEIVFGIGCCLLVLTTINKVVKDDLNFINKNAKTKRNRSLALNRLSEFIENHSAVNELSVKHILNSTETVSRKKC